MSSKNQLLLTVLNIVVFVWTVAVNSLAGATTLLNGRTSGQVSDAYPTLITPAGFTFSIWSIIYILLGAFVVYQALPRNRDKPFNGKISFLFILSGLLNMSWLFLWHYGFMTYSVILMFGLLASLIAIYVRLNIGKAKAPFRERICVHLPFSVYMGWITVASIANVSVALTFVGWDGGGIDPAIWAVLVIAVASLITLTAIATRKDVAYSLVIVWALFGIMSKQSSNQAMFWATGLSSIGILAALAVMTVVSRMRKQS
jgi:hypothetical protein